MSHPYCEQEDAALNAFRAREVDLTEAETKSGRAFRDQMIEQLETLSGRDNFPTLLIGQSFGAGSFGRRTLCQPRDDIDIYLVMNAGGGAMNEAGTFRLEGNAATPLTGDFTLRAGQWISSDLVLRRVASRLALAPIVRDHSTSQGLNPKGKSAYVEFGPLNVDITPVVWASTRSNVIPIDRYYMPQGRGSLWWKATNPKEDQRRLTQQNHAQAGLLLPTIRMLKWWNRNRNSDRLKGIHLEVMAERALSVYYPQGIALALHVCFCSISQQLNYLCTDPTGLGQPLDVSLSADDRAASKEGAISAHLCAVNAAQSLSMWDVTGAIAHWRPIFPV